MKRVRLRARPTAGRSRPSIRSRLCRVVFMALGENKIGTESTAKFWVLRIPKGVGDSYRRKSIKATRGHLKSVETTEPDPAETLNLVGSRFFVLPNTEIVPQPFHVIRFGSFQDPQFANSLLANRRGGEVIQACGEELLFTSPDGQIRPVRSPLTAVDPETQRGRAPGRRQSGSIARARLRAEHASRRTRFLQGRIASSSW